VALPIQSPSGIAIGALIIGSPTEEWASDDSLSLLKAIAGQTGQAMERARLHEAVVAVRDKEHTIAVLLQRALLPSRLVHHSQLAVSANYSQPTTWSMWAVIGTTHSNGRVATSGWS
jgi:hypothetical protein